MLPRVTKWYMLQNGMCYRMVRVTKWYMVQLQNGTCDKTKPHIMVQCTKQYIFNIIL
jgi:hypothetical protein